MGLNSTFSTASLRLDGLSVTSPLALFATSGSESSISLGLTAILATFISSIAYALYRPSVHPQSPPFTSDTLPIIGSLGFLSRQWSFWRTATGGLSHSFSFWLGSRHVVGITGAAARKMFYDNPDLCFVSQAIIQPFGVHFWPPIHDIFKAGFHSGRANTYFLRRLLELMKTEQLTKYLPMVTKDARAGLEALRASSPNSVISAPDIWRTVFRQNARVTFNNRAVDDAALLKQYTDNVGILLHTYSPFNALFNWLPEPAYIRRRLARWRLVRLVTAEVNRRMAPGAPREDDPLQILLDNGDKKDFIIEFFVSILFITTTNAHVISGQMLNIMAIHTDWQEKIYREIETAVETHAKHRHGTVVDKLGYLSLDVWETSFPVLNLCLKEAIRMWTSFSVTRLNTSPNPISIPGSDQVIPGKTFVIYNSTEVNFNESLYPNPAKFDPERYLEGREEFKKETYGFLGWGAGVHACAGMRWAKLQQVIVVAYALAMFQWNSCDANGDPDLHVKHRRFLDSDSAFHLPPAYTKLFPREEL